jgi:hypothetical protein
MDRLADAALERRAPRGARPRRLGRGAHRRDGRSPRAAPRGGGLGRTDHRKDHECAQKEGCFGAERHFRGVGEERMRGLEQLLESTKRAGGAADGSQRGGRGRIRCEGGAAGAEGRLYCRLPGAATNRGAAPRARYPTEVCFSGGGQRASFSSSSTQPKKQHSHCNKAPETKVVRARALEVNQNTQERNYAAAAAVKPRPADARHDADATSPPPTLLSASRCRRCFSATYFDRLGATAGARTPRAGVTPPASPRDATPPPARPPPPPPPAFAFRRASPDGSNAERQKQRCLHAPPTHYWHVDPRQIPVKKRKARGRQSEPDGGG